MHGILLFGYNTELSPLWYICAPSKDMYAQESIDLLQKSGIQFPVHDDEGIEPFEFAELITTSGVVLMDDVKWISFHRWVTADVHCHLLFSWY